MSHRPARHAAAAAVAALLLVVQPLLDATIGMQTMRAYMLARQAFSAALNKPCVTDDERERVRRLLDEASRLIYAAMHDRDVKLQASRERDGAGHPSKETLQLRDEYGELNNMSAEMNNDDWILDRFPPCPPPPEPPKDPPPPPPVPPSAPKPPARVAKDPHYRYTNCPKCTDLAKALNETIDSFNTAQEANAANQDQILAEIRRIALELNACEQACAPKQVASVLRRPAIVGGAAAAAVATAIAVSHGGSDAPTPAVSALPLRQPFTGTFTGAMQLATDARTCTGSTPEYTETAAVALDQNNSGTIGLSAAFDRRYPVMVDAAGSFAATATFTYLGQPVPGTLSGALNRAATPPTLTLQESTTFGGCTNTYHGVLR